MNVVFRADSSTQMGAGHLMRCLTLAGELQKKNHTITFICRELEGNIINLIDFKVIRLMGIGHVQADHLYLGLLGVTQECDAEQVIEVMPENTDLLFVDNYALDEIWHKKLRKYTDKIIVVDDLANKNFDCDVLLNQNLGVSKEDYKNRVPKGCKLLLGCKYALLRPEFALLRQKSLEKRNSTKEIKQILISLGGGDLNNVTFDILKELDSTLKIVVVLGNASPHKMMILNYSKNKNIEVIIDATNMAELMFNADLAIGAGGSTSWERCCLGLPTLMYVIAENQTMVAEHLEGLGAVIIVKNLKKDVSNLVNNIKKWKTMVNRSQKICDGLGTMRIKI